MSGTFPTDLIPVGAQIKSITNTRVSNPHSAKRTARSGDTQRFMYTLPYPPMTRADFARLYAFMMKQRGQFAVFQIELPPPFNAPQGSWATATSVKVDGANQTGRTLNLKDFTASQSDVVKAMDFFTIAGDLKVYTVVEDASSDGSGLATVTIEPALQIETLADGAVITHTNVQLTVADTSDELRLDVDTALHGRLSLELLEDP